MKRRCLLSLAAATACALFLAAGLAGGAGARLAAATATPSVLTFTDDTGDAGVAPDITNVSISGDAASRTLAFAVTATGLVPASPDGLMRSINVYVNTDRNVSTGSPSGSEYYLYFWSDETTPAGHFWWDIERWTGAEWQEVPQTATMAASEQLGTYKLALNASDLGGATSFSLLVGSIAVDHSGTLVASDSTQGLLRWVYDLAGPSRSMTKLVATNLGAPQASPAQLRAGRRVTVTLPATWKPDETTVPVVSGTMVCDPSVGGKVVAHAESFVNGVARLSFVVPKTAKGKQLRVKVTITPAPAQATTGMWVDIGSGETGVLAILVKGMPVTKIVTFRVL